MASRADKFTIEPKKREIYADFLNSFEQNPFTGMLSRVTNEESVKQALRNLILTNTGERFYDSNKGSKIRSSLFELYDIGLADAIRMQIVSAMQVYEPRAVIGDVHVSDTRDINVLQITIVFSILNIPNQNFSLSLNVSRVR